MRLPKRRRNGCCCGTVGLLCLWCFFFFDSSILVVTGAAATTTIDPSYDAQIMEHLQMFHYHPDVQVIGPSRFPKPTDIISIEKKKNDHDDNEEEEGEIVPFLTPIHGDPR
jgi:hypothetical protein